MWLVMFSGVNSCLSGEPRLNVGAWWVARDGGILCSEQFSQYHNASDLPRSTGRTIVTFVYLTSNVTLDTNLNFCHLNCFEY